MQGTAATSKADGEGKRIKLRRGPWMPENFCNRMKARPQRAGGIRSPARCWQGACLIERLGVAAQCICVEQGGLRKPEGKRVEDYAGNCSRKLAEGQSECGNN